MDGKLSYFDSFSNDFLSTVGLKIVNPRSAGNDFQAFQAFFSSVEAARKVLEWRNKGRFCGRYRVASRTSPKMFSLPYVTRGSLSSVCGKPYEAELPS